MSIINIGNLSEFNEQILNSNLPVLVDFWATWCGPCKMVAPELESAADMCKEKAIIAKVDVDKNSSIANQYNVQGVPTFLLIKNGNEIDRMVGYHTKKDLLSFIDKVL